LNPSYAAFSSQVYLPRISRRYPECATTSATQPEYKIQAKKLWRCHVCNDLHYGERPPAVCPTCGARKAFVEVDRDEALKVIGDRGGSIVAEADIVRVWEGFGGSNDEFNLTGDKEMYHGLAQGVLENAKGHGMKYCPCRITSGDPVADLKLVCPCNFQIQSRYKEAGECWCGLFVRRQLK